jgi:hypothetical protein
MTLANGDKVEVVSCEAPQIIPTPPVSNETQPPVSNETTPPVSNETTPPVSNETGGQVTHPIQCVPNEFYNVTSGRCEGNNLPPTEGNVTIPIEGNVTIPGNVTTGPGGEVNVTLPVNNNTGEVITTTPNATEPVQCQPNTHEEGGQCIEDAPTESQSPSGFQPSNSK